jgi:ATP-dependent Clp endopeptidase proteolytic subunit ClpP
VLLQYLRNPIYTMCVGQAASMASLLLTAGEAGNRRSLPNSRIMLHQPSGGASASAPVVIQADAVQPSHDVINKLYRQMLAQSKNPVETAGHRAACRGRPAISQSTLRRLSNCGSASAACMSSTPARRWMSSVRPCL